MADRVDPLTEHDKFDLQAALDLARWQGAVDADLLNIKSTQTGLAVAIGEVNAKVDGLIKWMMTAAASCILSAIVTVLAVVSGSS